MHQWIWCQRDTYSRVGSVMQVSPLWSTNLRGVIRVFGRIEMIFSPFADGTDNVTNWDLWERGLYTLFFSCSSFLADNFQSVPDVYSLPFPTVFVWTITTAEIIIGVPQLLQQRVDVKGFFVSLLKRERKRFLFWSLLATNGRSYTLCSTD